MRGGSCQTFEPQSLSFRVALTRLSTIQNLPLWAERVHIFCLPLKAKMAPPSAGSRIALGDITNVHAGRSQGRNEGRGQRNGSQRNGSQQNNPEGSAPFGGQPGEFQEDGHRFFSKEKWMCPVSLALTCSRARRWCLTFQHLTVPHLPAVGPPR